MDYQGNSDKKKQKEIEKPKHIEKVVTGEVIQKQKSFGRKFKDIFFSGDFKTTATYVLGDVIFPAIRDMIADSGKRGLDSLVYGDKRMRGNNSQGYRPTVQYNNPVWRGGNSTMRDPRERPVYLPDQPPRYRRSNTKDASEFIVGTREEAERVVEMMVDILNQGYSSVSLADLFVMLDIKSTPIDNKWGWTFLGNVNIHQVRNGYLIELPPLEEL